MIIQINQKEKRRTLAGGEDDKREDRVIWDWSREDLLIALDGHLWDQGFNSVQIGSLIREAEFLRTESIVGLLLSCGYKK